nr:hypothetical protein Iba_chr03aCG2150 [Ipomoea batatas]
MSSTKPYRSCQGLESQHWHWSFCERYGETVAIGGKTVSCGSARHRTKGGHDFVIETSVFSPCVRSSHRRFLFVHIGVQVDKLGFCDGVWGVEEEEGADCEAVEESSDEEDKTSSHHGSDRSGGVRHWFVDEARRLTALGSGRRLLYLLLPSLPAISSPGVAASYLRRAAAATESIRQTTCVDQRLPYSSSLFQQIYYVKKLCSQNMLGVRFKHLDEQIKGKHSSRSEGDEDDVN